MKKKLFVLLAVICLIAAIVPLTASAAELDTTITIENGGEMGYYEFTASVTGYYVIASQVSNEDPRGYLYDSDMNCLAENDDYSTSRNFQISAVLEAGETYYVGACFFNDWVTGDIPITFQVFEGHTTLYADTDTNALITYGGEEVKYAFTPDHSESYTFYSVSDGDTYGSLYDSEGNELISNDSGGDGSNFSITYDLEAGVTYYFGARFYYKSDTGVIPVYLRTNHVYSEEVLSTPTCAEKGLTRFTCETCGHIYECVTSVPHSWNADNVCSVCGADWYVEGSCGGTTTWKLDLNGTLTISGTGGMDNYETSSDINWYNYISSITAVVIEDGVTSIGDYAFCDCTSLTSVTIADSVTSIGKYAFGDCDALTSITIPASVTSIGSYAFQYAGLTSVTIAGNATNIDDCAFICCSDLTGITFQGDAPVVGDRVFYGVTANAHYPADNATWTADVMKHYGGTLAWMIYHGPANVLASGYCGAQNANLMWVYTDEGVLTVSGTGDMADWTNTGALPWYKYRYQMKSVIIEEGVTSVGNTAFYWFTNLESVKLPESLIRIGEQAFAQSNQMTEFVIPAGVQEIDDNAFQITTIQDFYFEGDAPTFGSGVFAYATVNVHYPAANTTWTSSVKQDYWGTVTWIPEGELPTAINTQPTPQKVTAGSTATFAVEAVGIDLSYQWQTKTSSSGSWKDCTFDGSQTATMSVPATTARNGYYYRCVITDGNGESLTTDIVRLYVLGVKTQPATQKVKAGATAKFTVSATGSGKTYQWQTKTSSSGSWKNCTFTGSKTATMSVSATTARNGYYYRCKITDDAGNVVYTNTVRLYVLSIKTQPTTQKVKAGSTAKFTVSATGSGLTYQWQTKTSSSGSWKNCTFTGSKTATMSVSATTARNGYYYRCKITDSAGNVTYTNTVRLYVLGIKTQPTSKTVKSGNTAKFTVSATGSGLTYQWQYKTSSGWKNTTLTGAKTATLSVKGTSARNGMKYRCKITDSAGNVIYTNTVKLTVK